MTVKSREGPACRKAKAFLVLTVTAETSSACLNGGLAKVQGKSLELWKEGEAYGDDGER